MPIFLERFILPLSAACVLLLFGANPMGFDWTQRLTLAGSIILLALFISHTLHLRNDNKDTVKQNLSSPQAGGVEPTDNRKLTGRTAPKMQHRNRDGLRSTQEPADRHLSELQSTAIDAVLKRYPAGKIAFITFSGRDERIGFGKELERVFVSAGWTVMPTRADVEEDFRHTSFFDRLDNPGVSVLRHSQGNMPNLEVVDDALQAARIPHTIVDIGNPVNAGIFRDNLDTSWIVVFIGPKRQLEKP